MRVLRARIAQVHEGDERIVRPVFASSIGTKIVMAVSGALLALFLVAHMLGNLELFAGPDALNGYGALLRRFPPLLWVARIGLLVLFVVHIAASIRVARINRAARPAGYAVARRLATTWAARTMLVSGTLVALFVVFHLLHFTLRTVQPEYREWHDALGRHDVYRMVSDAFQRPPIVAYYAVMMLLLGLHLSHGVASAVHTLGVDHPRYARRWRFAGPAFAVLLIAGFVAVPLAVLAGLAR